MEPSKRLADNLRVMRERLGEGVSFDVIVRQIDIGGKDAALIFLDGMVKDMVTTSVIRALQTAPRDSVRPNTIEKLLAHVIPFMELSVVETLDEAIDQVLAGPMVLLIDGERSAIILDLQEYPVRGIQEPDLERVTRGSREGFVETLVFNTALIRRRLRDPNLRFRMHTIGTRTKTDVVIAYLEGVVDPDLLERVQSRVLAAGDDAMPLGAKSLEEYVSDSPASPVPTVRFTERPDVAVAHLLEGHVLVIVDTTPMVMILPATLWHFTQHAEEFFQTPTAGSYLRGVRILGMIVALLITPTWLALVLTKPNLPDWLAWLGPQEGGYLLPLWLQFLLLEFGVDLIRMALIHTPNALATSLGIVGAILLGELAIQVGLFVPETILFTSLAVLGYFATPSIEFGLAIRIGRYILLILAALWALPGLAAGIIAIFIYLSTLKSQGVPYLWPLIPFDGRALFSLLFRHPVPSVRGRQASKVLKDSRS